MRTERNRTTQNEFFNPPTLGLSHHSPGRENTSEVIRIYQDQVTHRGFGNRSKELPISGAIILPTWRVRRVPRVSSVARRKVTRGRTVVGRAAVHVRVWGRVVATVWVIVAAPGRRVVVNGSTAWGRSVPGTIVVVVAARAPLAVPIAVGVSAWTETTRRWPASVPVITRRIRTASARRARSTARVPRNIRLGLQQISDWSRGLGDGGKTYVGYAGHALLLEVSAVESLHGLLKVRGRLKLHEAVALG